MTSSATATSSTRSASTSRTGGSCATSASIPSSRSMSQPTELPPAHPSNDVWVVYDGQCPFCSSYVRLYRIRERGSRVSLIDARSAHPLVDEVRRRNLDLDRGMV